MMDVYRMNCCGVVEAHGIYDCYCEDDVRNGLINIITRREERGFGLVVFTTVAGDSADGMYLFRKIVKRAGLGGVRPVKKFKNPNTNNMVTVWVFEPDFARITKWLEKKAV